MAKSQGKLATLGTKLASASKNLGPLSVVLDVLKLPFDDQLTHTVPVRVQVLGSRGEPVSCGRDERQDGHRRAGRHRGHHLRHRLRPGFRGTSDHDPHDPERAVVTSFPSVGWSGAGLEDLYPCRATSTTGWDSISRTCRRTPRAR